MRLLRNIFFYFAPLMLTALMAFECGKELDPPPGKDDDTEIPSDPGQGENPGQDPDQGGTPDPTPDPEPTPEPEPEPYYVKVTENLSDWSGDYLVAYETSTSIKVFNYWTGDDKGASTVDLGSKYGPDGIPAADGDPYKATITKVGSDYTIYITGVGYIGCESSANTLDKQSEAPSSTDTRYQWEFSYQNGLWITNVGQSRRLQWNASASIFRCYTGGQEDLTLYRRTTSGGSVTPTPDPEDPTPDPDPETPTPDPTPDPDEPEDPTPDPDPTPNPGQSQSNAKYGWYELPVVNYSQEGSSYLTETTDKYGKVYYAHHFCAGGEKYGHNGKTARNYTVCYSAEHHCPVWVAAIRHSGLFPSKVDRTNSYGKDPSVPSDIQYNSTSTGGGCNKGHMLGSAERTSSTATNKQVFYYTNIAPQYSSTFNTGGGGWNTLEDWVDGKVCSDTLYMVIGTYFDQYTDPRGISASPSTISFGGRSDVSCPTMFYYALLRTKSGNTGKPLSKCSANEIMCAAFVRSHKTPMKTAVSSAEMMSISDLEKLTGFTFFPNVPNAPKSSYKASEWGL